MKTFLVMLAASTIFYSPAFAHEGHNQTPGQIKSLHGGVVKAGNELNMEMLFSDDKITLFPLAHSGEDLNISEVNMTGTAKIPKSKPSPLSFKNDGKSYSATVDLKNSYRSDIEIKAQYKGKTDIFKFLVEK